MVMSLSPFGCMTDLGVSCTPDCAEGAPLAKRIMLAAVSSNTMEFILGGLAQPEEIVVEHSKLYLLAFSMTKSTAGLHHHFDTQSLLALLPLMVLQRVAFS